MSPNRNQACSSCHMPYAGFTGPIRRQSDDGGVSGTAHFRAGKRTTQRYTYSPISRTPLQRDPGSSSRQLLGFARDRLHSAATRSEQAQHPPSIRRRWATRHCLHRVQAVTGRVQAFLRAGMGPGRLISSSTRYRGDLCNPWGRRGVRYERHAGSTDAGRPPPGKRGLQSLGQSIDAYEGSLDLSAFSSKFDAFLAGNATLTEDEMKGYQLFDGRATATRATSTDEGRLSPQVRPTPATPPP